MKTTVQRIPLFALSLLVLAASHPAACQETGVPRTASPPTREVVEVSQTNWVTRVITNVTEIRMTTNVFVTEYRTNWIEHAATNVVEVLKAVWLTRTLTNVVPVELVKSNVVVAYRTNWKTLTLTNREAVVVMRTNWVQQPVTNVVEVYATNWATWTVTRTVPVELVKSNVVLAYQTNWRTLTLTNWETVVVRQTNWVRKQATNVVELEMRARPPVEKEMASSKVEPTEIASALAPAEGADDYVLETVRTGKPVTNNQVEVLLKVKSASDLSAPIEVQNWRVERADRAILLFGQDSEFKRALPMGTYNVQVKVRRDANNPFSTLRATIAVTPEGVVQQKPAVILN